MLFSFTTAIRHCLLACILCGLSAAVSAQTTHPVTWNNPVGVTLSGLVMTKTASNGWGNSGAESSESLAANTDGLVEYIVDATEELDDRAFGLTRLNTTQNEIDIDHCIAIVAGKVEVYDRGAYVGKFSLAKPNDVLRVERTGSTVTYWHNGVSFYQSITNASFMMHADAAIFIQNGTLTNVTATFGTPAPTLDATYTTTNANCELGLPGTIDLTVSGGAYPYTISWAHGASGSSVTGLEAGMYRAVITDANSTQISRDINVYAPVSWYLLDGVSANGADLSKTGATGWAEGHAMSAMNLEPEINGSVEYVYDGFDGAKIIGLSYADEEPSTDIATIDYGFLFGLSDFRIEESGTTIQSFGAAQQGDVFRITRWDNNINYYQNDVLIRTSTTDATRGLVVNVGLQDPGSEFNGMLASFCYGPVETVGTSTAQTPTTKGSISVRPWGGKPPYIYSWDGAGIAPSAAEQGILPDLTLFPQGAPTVLDGSLIDGERSGLESDFYSVRVTDALGNQSSREIPLLPEMYWMNVTGLTIDASNTIEKTAGDGWGNAMATAANSFNAGVDGGIAFELPDGDAELTIGLRLDGNPQAQSYSDMDYAFYMNDGDLFLYYNGALSAQVASLHDGDVLAMKRIGFLLQFTHNGTALGFTSIDETKDYWMDVAMHDTQTRIEKAGTPKVTYWPKVKVTLDHLDCGTVNNGSMTIDYEEPKGTSNYLISVELDGQQVSQSANPSGLAAGQYTVNVTYQSPNAPAIPISVPVELAWEVDWVDVVDATATDNNLVKTNGTNSAYSAGGNSGNLLGPGQDGWAEFRFSSSDIGTAGVFFGISDARGFLNTMVPDVYGFVITKWNQDYYVRMLYWDQNSNGYSAILGTCEHGDVFRIMRDGTTVRWFRNGQEYNMALPGLGISMNQVPIDNNKRHWVGVTLGNHSTEILDAVTNMSCPPQPEPWFPRPYMVLEKLPDGDAHPVEAQQPLRFKYHEEYTAKPNIDLLDYRIYDCHTHTLQMAGNPPSGMAPQYSSDPLPVATGDNWFDLCLDGLPAGYYILEVVNQKDRSEFLRFEYDGGQSGPCSP